VPARLLGGASGLATAALVAATLAGSETILNRDQQPEVQELLFADFVGSVANQVFIKAGTLANTHSSSVVEGDQPTFNPGARAQEVDCAFMTHLGEIVYSTQQPEVKTEVEFVQTLMGTDLPTQEALTGLAELAEGMHTTLQIGRKAVSGILADPGLRTPFVVLGPDSHTQSDIRIVYDHLGVLADANTTALKGNSHYHNSPPIAAELLMRCFPEHNYGKNILQAILLVLQVSTRQALEEKTGHKIPADIIPAEYAVAA
jgi:hypothetical protein